MAYIPIIDFNLFGLDNDKAEVIDDVTLQGLVAEIKSALTSSGFMYLRNHGIEESTIQNVFTSARKFFELPDAVKQKCELTHGSNHGWIPLRGESLDPGANVDLMERLTFLYKENQNLENWPLEEVPSLRKDLEQFFYKCHLLAQRVLSVIALALGKDRHFFENFHRLIGKDGSRTVASAVYYPPISDGDVLKEKQLRLGAHCDYGSITLLFQDDIGGLEIWNKAEEKFFPAHPIPDSVIVNIGDALQRWTSDRLVSNKHRVVIPTSADCRQRARQSMTFFVNPDEDAVLSCVDGSDKYPPITMGEYLDSIFKTTQVSY